MLGKTSVYWKSTNQEFVALSSTDAEYFALCAAVQVIIWMRVLLAELDETMDKPTTVFEDNQGAIKWANDGVRNAKDVAIRRNFIHSAVKNKLVEIT